MNNKILQTILDIPIFWRAFIVLFLLWFLYLIFSRGIFKLLSLAISLINRIWLIPYLLFNNVMHVIHKMIGRSFIGADQAVTNFFGNVYNFIYKIKMTTENARIRKIPIYDVHGKQALDKNGIPQYNYVPKRPFAGYALILSLLLVLWISIPTWLHTEEKNNYFNVAYATYINVEDSILGLIFSNQ